MTQLPFQDRAQAARALADALASYRGSRPVVLGIPRGGMPMARIVADALGGELDMILVRKLGAPGNPEYAIGSVDERGSILLNDDAEWTGADEAYVRDEARVQMALMRERRARYGGGTVRSLSGRTVIVLDDGLATGSTMEAALRAVRAQHPASLVCAVPVAAPDSLAHVRRFADEIVCLATPHPFRAVSLYYRRFPEVTDEEVTAALRESAAPKREQAVSELVHIPAGQRLLEGALTVPDAAVGLVVFAHGSGSSRHSSRNRFVADALAHRTIATLLFDLLTPQEDALRANRFDIDILAERLETAVAWVSRHPRCRGLPLGLFGASTGAAAALRVAAEHPDAIAAVVSRGGRADLAGRETLQQVRCPVLLIIGSADREVLALNQAARRSIGACAELRIVPGAGHLFEEPGTLEAMAALAADWFQRRLSLAGAGHAVPHTTH
ncbi:alpha/beta family hydrolase [Tahibacter caeni]|uniref:alpha/beta family hydrolase n=1 Tax=Tahibacter caeni TaxID=1453545 RepID=UPI0021485199|nr:alpha/beta family hydrolase [Tahibacter caeni]